MRRQRYILALGSLTVIAGLVTGCSAGDGEESGPSDSATTPSASGTGDAGGPTDSGTAGGEGGDSSDDASAVPAERVLVCDFSASELEGMLGPDEMSSETLRTAVPVLQEKLDELRSGGDALPSSERVVGAVESVLASWEQALAAYDAGNPAGAENALATAEAEIQTLDASLVQEPLDGC